jgi:hypothetical protein
VALANKVLPVPGGPVNIEVFWKKNRFCNHSILQVLFTWRHVEQYHRAS